MARSEKAVSKVSREAFFDTLSESGNVTAACHVALLKRRFVEKLRERDADWAADWDDAMKIANDAIEAEIRRRAIHGTTRIVISMGKIVIGPEGEPLKVQEYSDKMLELHAKANMPEKYGNLAGMNIPALPADLAPDPAPVPDEPGPANPKV